MINLETALPPTASRDSASGTAITDPGFLAVLSGLLGAAGADANVGSGAALLPTSAPDEPAHGPAEGEPSQGDAVDPLAAVLGVRSTAPLAALADALARAGSSPVAAGPRAVGDPQELAAGSRALLGHARPSAVGTAAPAPTGAGAESRALSVDAAATATGAGLGRESLSAASVPLTDGGTTSVHAPTPADVAADPALGAVRAPAAGPPPADEISGKRPGTSAEQSADASAEQSTVDALAGSALLDAAETTAPRPAETGPTGASPLISRILDAVEQLENAPPPRQLTLEVGELRVRLSVEDGNVRLQLLGDQRDAGQELLRDAAAALRARGFDLQGDDRGGQHGDRRRSGSEDESPSASPRPDTGRRLPGSGGLRL